MMRSSVELFWALFDEDSFEAHRGELGNDAIVRLLQDIRGRGDAITTAEMSVLAVHDPAAFAERLPQRLRELTERFTPSYVPDEPDDAEALFVAAHLQASRLAFYLIQSAAGRDDRLFDYGEDVDLLAKDLEGPIARLNVRHKESARRIPLQIEKHEQPFALARWGIESLLAHVDSYLAAERGEYARALERLDHSSTLAFIVDIRRRQWVSEALDDFPFPWDFSDEDWMPPWLSGFELPAQAAVDWFEALKGGPDVHKQDWSALAVTCNDLSDLFERDIEVVDDKGGTWDWYTYWQRAASWAEAQLTPDQLRDLLQAQEDKAAETRLRAYFFADDQWEALSKGARDALISADRAWVSSRNKSQVLNGLRIATEDILYHGLWPSLVKWAKGQTDPDLRGLRDVQAYLEEHRYEAPGLAQYERILGVPGVERYLKDERGLDDNVAFIKKQRRQFKKLRESRRDAEHVPVTSVAAGRIRDIYAQFLGIGPKRRAILPELVRILRRPPPK